MPVENYVRRAYEFFRNHCYPVRNISNLVAKGDCFVLALPPEEVGEDKVVGVVSVDEVNDPPKANELPREDIDYLAGKVLSQKIRKAPDDIVLKFCSTRLNCSFASAFSNQKFQIQLLKPTCETDCPEYTMPRENTDPEIDRSIPFLILSNIHTLPITEIENLKKIDNDLRFRLIPLDQFIKKQKSSIRNNCAKAVMDVLDPDIGPLHNIHLKGQIIGTAKINDVVEPYGDLDPNTIQEIIRLIKTSGCGSIEDLERIIYNQARDSVSTIIDSCVTLSDKVDSQHRGKTVKMVFRAFTSRLEDYTSSDLCRVRNVVLLPDDNDPQVLEIFKDTAENPVFTFFKKDL